MKRYEECVPLYKNSSLSSRLVFCPRLSRNGRKGYVGTMRSCGDGRSTVGIKDNRLSLRVKYIKIGNRRMIVKYDNIKKAIFLNRPNRFIAEVEVDGKRETVHVKNTGRCKELLIPGCEVWLTEPVTPGRKTRYDLVAVRKNTGVLFNIDSQAPNKVAREWLETQEFETIIPEKNMVIPESIFIWKKPIKPETS